MSSDEQYPPWDRNRTPASGEKDVQPLADRFFPIHSQRRDEDRI